MGRFVTGCILLLAYRAIYYLLPLLIAGLVFAGSQLKEESRHLVRLEALFASYIAPVAPQIIGTLAFVAGVLLLVSGATPSINSRLAALRHFVPLPLLETSHLIGSVSGVGLLILARSLFRRVREGYRLTLWLLGTGIAASILKGLDFEEAGLLAIVLGALWLGRRAFYRRASIIGERFTPAWVASIAGVLGAVIWIGFFAHRHVEYSSDLWWTFAVSADAPRMLRASLLAILVAGAFLALNLLRPAKIGEEARVPLADFSLDGSDARELRQAHGRAVRDGAVFEVVPAGLVETLLPALRRISDAWLKEKATGEKGFSIGAFREDYIRRFPIALVRCQGSPVAFANLWTTATLNELSIDLMRFGADAPHSVMDFLFTELMPWGRTQGYRWFSLGMAPLAGLGEHALAPSWHRIGNFIFHHGEHFYNFEGLRRFKAKFTPVWEPKYLLTPGGLMVLPRVLMDVSVLIAGGVKELLAK